MKFIPIENIEKKKKLFDCEVNRSKFKVFVTKNRFVKKKKKNSRKS